MREEVLERFRGYDRNNLAIATMGSHSALQILKGAQEEGFKSIVVCEPERKEVYRRFGVADRIITVENYGDMLEGGETFSELQRENALLVPHGSYVAHIGVGKVENELTLPMLGNRGILRWESDRDKERKWLHSSGIKMPRETKDPRDIDSLSIVKFPGARGGRGYFLVSNYQEFKEKTAMQIQKGRLKEEDIENATIQEYIPGVSMYLSYFYSPLKDGVELFGIDQRLEANIDGLTRIPAFNQNSIEPSYVVVGNQPVVIRESLLPRVFEMGDSLVEKSKEFSPPGMLGPFCLETMVSNQLEFIAFEISSRIVAGTNPYTQGSPYSYLQYGHGMSMGRRIARELNLGLKEEKEEQLIT